MADFRAGSPRILGIGGTLRAGSSSEQALRMALRAAERRGAIVELLCAPELDFPAYQPETADSVAAADRLIAAARRADGLIIATPGYHGGMSGLLKNAIDYLQALADDPSPYLQGKAVGCIVAAAGAQAGGSTLASLRATAHALRGWPTPLGVAINSATPQFDRNGDAVDPKIGILIDALAAEVVAFARASADVMSACEFA
jgi:FMN reductase